TLSWQVGYEQAGTYNLTVRASDGLREIATNVTLLISEAARPVTLRTPGKLTAVEGDRIRFNLQAEAEPGTPLSFGVVDGSLPFGATLNASTGEFEWIPGYTQADTYEITFAVSDGNGLAVATMEIEVTPGNGAPIFDNFDGLQIYEGQNFVLRAFAKDPDNPFYEPGYRDVDGEFHEAGDLPKTVQIEVVGDLPEGASFDTETWELFWVPGAAQAGEYEITFRATDDGAESGEPISVEETARIKVLDLNLPPVLSELTNISIARDATQEIPVSAIDPDGDPIELLLINEQPGIPLPDFIT
ncbi:putative Ig domain-containing protein, partial [Cribrihabitans sp. XS_ASV171]